MPVFSIIVDGKSGVNTIYTSNVSAEDGEYVISPKIKKDTNKADSFEFMILPDHSFYDEFEKKKTYVYVKRDNKYIFRGRVSEIKTDIFRQRTITCEGELAYLADTVQFPNKETTTQKNTSSTKKYKRNTLYYASGHESGHETGSSSKDTVKMTPKAYFQNVIAVHNGQVNTTGDNARMFTVGSVTVSGANTAENFERTSHQDTSSVISSDLLSVYGGILRTRFENNTTYIDWLDEYTDTTSQEIKFGVNLIDLDQEPPSDDAWSVLLPIGDENTTIASANNGSKFLINQDALDKYGYIVHYHKFNNVKKSDELKSRAQKYLNTHAKVFPDNIVVKAIDLQLIGESNDPIELGDKVKVVSTPHGLSTTMACIKMELDIQNPENNSYTIGTIMPPDKEKKKESLSEKQNSSSRSSSRGIGNNRNDIEGLMGDMDAASNNINVNAENIAVNALNIAVNAENIAIVAKNIAIAAEQIDVQAQNITVALGNEADDLYGKIEASAEGIKSTFTDNTTGLSSYFSQKAGEITAAISNADGSISGKITMTEESLTTEYNKKLYGDDGNGGIVADYKHRIETTAKGTREYFEETLYGEDRDPNNPSKTSFYFRVRNDTAKESRDYMEQTLYGEDGESGLAKAIREETSEYTKTYFSKQMYGEDGESGLYEAIYVRSVNEFNNILSGPDGAYSQIQQLDDAIKLRVGKDELKSSISLTDTGITIYGQNISLQGYATVESISGTNGMFTRLVSGSDTATHLKATTLSADTLQVYRSAGSASEYKKYYVSMVKRNDTTYYTTDYVLSTNSSGILDLSHSHSCTTNSDGTITLGGAVAAGSGGSFKIADTKAYKDGVSAATAAVTVDSVGLNTTDYTGSGIGTSQSSNTPIWFSSPKTFYARIRANASNGKHREASITIDATKAYDAVTVDSVGLNTTDYTGSGIGTSQSSNTPIWFSSPKTFYARIRAVASNSKHREASITIDGTKAYDAGVASVTVSSVSGTKGSLSSDKKSVSVNLSATASNNASKTGTVNIDIKDSYNAGVSSVDVTSVIRNPGHSDSYKGGSDHSTTIHIRAAASNGHQKDANFDVSGTSAYNDGVNSVTISSVSGSKNSLLSDNKTVRVNLSATASNSKTGSGTADIDVTDAYNAGNTAGYNSGYDSGYSTGYDGGFNGGYSVGYSDGNSAGHTAGYNEGYTAGRNSVNLNDVSITAISVNAATGNAMVTMSLPNAAGTKRCTNVTIRNLD